MNNMNLHPYLIYSLMKCKNLNFFPSKLRNKFGNSNFLYIYATIRTQQMDNMLHYQGYARFETETAGPKPFHLQSLNFYALDLCEISIDYNIKNTYTQPH